MTFGKKCARIENKNGCRSNSKFEWIITTRQRFNSHFIVLTFEILHFPAFSKSEKVFSLVIQAESIMVFVNSSTCVLFCFIVYLLVTLLLFLYVHWSLQKTFSFKCCVVYTMNSQLFLFAQKMCCSCYISGKRWSSELD